jgi:hypothetical protein
MTRSAAILRSACAAVVVMLLLVVLAPAATAYEGEGTFRIQLSGPSGTVRCDRTVQIRATARLVRDNSPAVRENMTWRIVRSVSDSDSFSDARTRTNRRGRTSTRLIFGPTAGARTIEASLAAGDSTARITVRCAGGLPETFPDLAGAAGQLPGGLAPVAGLIAIAAGFALLGRRRVRRSAP